MDNMLQQPPLKKLSTNGAMGVVAGAMGVVAVNSMQGVAVGGSDGGLCSENIPGSSGRRDKTDVQSQTLALAWKEETDGGRLLSSLFEHFDLSMFSFTPAPELSLFL